MATQGHVGADTRLVTFIGQFVVDRNTELTEVADPPHTTYQPIDGKVASSFGPSALLPFDGHEGWPKPVFNVFRWHLTVPGGLQTVAPIQR